MKRIYTFIFIALLASLPSWGISRAELWKDSYWSDFRKALPNPYQTIGFADFEDASQLYIISEPPEDVALEQIERAFAGTFYDIDIKKWEYGADGWVKDVVVTVDYAPDNCEFEIIPILNQLLYGASSPYIYQPLPLKEKRKLYLENSLNVSVNASSLHQWFVTENMPLEDLWGESTSFTQISKQAKNALYFSQEPGFVIWTLPVEGSIGTKDPTFRQFTLFSDMIIGAVASSNTLCIIGRERQEDFLDLPPLRTEEVAMLAWAPNELSQSLDIAGFLTTKMSDNTDWCPAYLSEELNNTEVGHLLTLTDIFLKDWIGKTYYDYPYEYSRPSSSFSGNLDEKRSTIYNWNTEGLYAKTNYPSYSVFTIRNTGCLNGSFFDNSSAVEETPMDEKGANEYLASINNVDFFRVAQYFALYQMFKEYGITCPYYHANPSMDKRNFMTSDARQVLSRLRNMSTQEKDEAAYQIGKDEFDNRRIAGFDTAFAQVREREQALWDKQFRIAAANNAYIAGTSIESYQKTQAYKAAKQKSDAEFNIYIEDLYKRSKKAAILKDYQYVKDSISSLLRAARAIPSEDIEGFCHYCSSPRELDPCYRQNISKYRKYEANLKRSWCIPLYGRFLGIDIESIKNHYQQQAMNDTAMWHKTPKIVTSNNPEGRTMGADGKKRTGSVVGGHSIKKNVEYKEAHFEKIQPKGNFLERASAYATKSMKATSRDERIYYSRKARWELPTTGGEWSGTKMGWEYTFEKEVKRQIREQSAQRAERERRTHQISEQRSNTEKRIDDLINDLSQTPEDRENNAKTIRWLNRQKEIVQNSTPQTVQLPTEAPQQGTRNGRQEPGKRTPPPPKKEINPDDMLDAKILRCEQILNDINATIDKYEDKHPTTRRRKSQP